MMQAPAAPALLAGVDQLRQVIERTAAQHAHSGGRADRLDVRLAGRSSAWLSPSAGKTGQTSNGSFRVMRTFPSEGMHIRFKLGGVVDVAAIAVRRHGQAIFDVVREDPELIQDDRSGARGGSLAKSGA